MSLHLADPDLIRLLDDAVDGQDRVAVERHLATCTVCAARLRLVEQRINRLEELLLDGDPPVPVMDPPATRRPHVPSLVAAAAIIAVLAGAAVTVRPVRAWIVERSHDLWMLVAGRSQDTVETPQGGNVPSATTASVTFTPVRQPFVIRVAKRQAGGNITVETGAVTDVTALVLGGGDTEDLLVLPDGLLVRNSDESEASYRVTVPASLDTVRVEVDGRVLVTLAPRGGFSRWTGELGASGPP